MHPPKSAAETEWFAVHAVDDGLTLERIRSAHSRLPWLDRMGSEYHNANEGCYMCWLLARTDSLVEALERIAAGEGRYSRDPLTHATNTVEDMQTIARDALASLAAPPPEPIEREK
jgi:hypothetical protein